jgi:carboxypeptidase PM20D1
MRSALRVLVLGLVAVLVVVLFRAATLRSVQPDVAAAPRVELDEDAIAARLARGLSFQTISYEDDRTTSVPAFRAFQDFLASAYPKLHARLARERVAGQSLLYTWRGSEPGLDPIVLLAHQDVVPVDPGSEGDWQQPPFGGEIADGSVWGRGALDDKGSLFAQLEAVEGLLEAGFEPRRTVHLAFGHDEELGGWEGAAGIASLLGERGIQPAYVLDEGGGVARGLFPLVERSVATIGIAEKGSVTAELSVEVEGGHSSTPAFESAIGILARAVDRLEVNQRPSRLQSAMRGFLEDGIGPDASFPMRLVLANLWLFRPLVEMVMSRDARAAASLRTTTAPTIFQAGVKRNVLPRRARAVVNFRIQPGETIEGVLAHVEQTVDDPRVSVGTVGRSREPSPESRVDSEVYADLARTIREIFPDAIVAPYLVLGGTDARHFRGLSENVYRFAPLRFTKESVPTLHGTDERVRIADHADAVRFYRRLLENTAH